MKSKKAAKKATAKPAAKAKPRSRAMDVEVEIEPDEQEDLEEEEQDRDEDEDDEEDDMADEQQSSSGYQEPGGGGGGDEQEKNQVLGHIIDPQKGFKYYPREEVRKDLIAEVVAQEKYEDEDYDSRIKLAEENKKKADEALSTMKYDPDKLREEAEKANKAATDPKQVEAQAKAIQELRNKLYPQPPGAGAGK